jgi:AraC family transcriptional regulator, regulatory protein of adaptative response / DNA-3-methyladenine glycosylase II
VKGARTLAARLARRYGKPLTAPAGRLTHLFPTAEALAAADPAQLGLPRARGAAVCALAAAIATGDITVDAGADRDLTARRLVALPGIGPWTASYISMRALGDPDVFLATDLGARRSLELAGLPSDVRSVAALAERWRPWRSYALQYVWHRPTEGAA